MIIYRLSSPYLHDAISPFAIDQEQESLGRKSVLLQSPGRHMTDAPIWPPMGPQKRSCLRRPMRKRRGQDGMTSPEKEDVSAASKSEEPFVDELNIFMHFAHLERCPKKWR